MTEIEFLVQTLINFEASDELRKHLLARIGEIEKTRNEPALVNPVVSYPQTIPLVITPCQHQYPSGPWGSSVPPQCIKCGQSQYGGAGDGNFLYGGSSGGGGSSQTFTLSGDVDLNTTLATSSLPLVPTSNC
jgi:hypothetical protein